jgi:hypothetical protein
MGLGEDLGGIGEDLGDVSDIVGGYVGGAQSAAEAVFVRGVDLASSDGNIRGAHPPDDQATQNTGATIEFIHFGYVHPDSSQSFEHSTEINDTQKVDLETGPNSRAIMFRAALEREAILLNGFIASTQTVLGERESALGGIGEAIAVATDLLGGGEGSKAPKGSDLNEPNSKVASSAGSINESPITYTDIHKTGIALQEARAQYRALLKRVKEKPEGDQPGLLSSVDSIAGALPGMGEIFSLISGIYTKAFDIYVAFYAYLAYYQEPVIERACHNISIQAIRENAPVVFPVWSHIPEDAGDGGGSSLPGALGEAVNSVNGAIQDVRDFFEGSTPDCPGSDFLPSAFSITPPDREDQPPPMPKDLAKTIIDGFRTQIKIIPEPVLDIIQTIVEYDSEFVQAVYQRLVERAPTLPILESEVYAAGRRHLLDRLMKYVIGLSSLLQRLMRGVNVQGIQMSPERLIDEALDKLNDEILSKLNPIFRLTMKDFAENLEGLRLVAEENKCHTMELYLSRLPYLLALLFRDTFFPIWDLIVENIFGPIGGPVQGFMDSFRTFREGVQSEIDSVRDYAKKAENLAKRWEQEDGIHAGTGDSNVGGYMSDLDSTAERRENPQKQAILDTFPLIPRKPEGIGAKIKNQEWMDTSKNHKWETALRSEPAL